MTSSDDLVVPARATRTGVPAWVAAAGDLVAPSGGRAGTVYLVLDHSTSMGDPGKMAQLRRGALRFFLEAVRRDYAVGAVRFASDTGILVGAGIDAHRFWKRLHDLVPYGSTAMAEGIALTTSRFRHRAGDRVMILITDGVPDDAWRAVAAARRARALGITLIAIGTGNADRDFLATLTGRPELSTLVTTEGLAGALSERAERLGATAAAPRNAQERSRHDRS